MLIFYFLLQKNFDFDEILQRKSFNPQPSLVYKGDKSEKDLQYFLILEKIIVDIGCSPIKATDLLYKSHYVFNVHYCKPCEAFF